MRVDAAKYGNITALHQLGALSVSEARDENDSLIGYDLYPDVDLTGYGDAVTGLTKPVVPASVSKAQAKIQLLRTPGSAKTKTLLDDVTAAVQAAGGETAIWFSDAQIWDRNSTYVETLSGELSLTADQVDQMFIEAAKISA